MLKVERFANNELKILTFIKIRNIQYLRYVTRSTNRYLLGTLKYLASKIGWKTRCRKKENLLVNDPAHSRLKVAVNGLIMVANIRNRQELIEKDISKRAYSI